MTHSGIYFARVGMTCINRVKHLATFSTWIMNSISFLSSEHYSHWNDKITKFQDLLGKGFYRNEFLWITDRGVYLRSIDGEGEDSYGNKFSFQELCNKLVNNTYIF